MDTNSNFSQDFLDLIRDIREPVIIKVIKVVFEDSSLQKAADNSGATLLHYSALYNNENLTKYLLDKGCDVNIRDSRGTTPLMIAVEKDHGNIVNMLLSAGADILILNSEKKGALHMQHTMSINTMSIFLRKLQKKCSTYQEVAMKLLDAHCPLYLAVTLKDARIIEYMIKRGSSVDSTHPVHKATALHIAVLYDDLKSMNVLLEYGADVNARDSMGENSLYQLYKKYPEHNSEKVEILKILLKQGVSIASCTSSGVFNGLNALTKGNREAVGLLLNTGIDFSVTDDNGRRNVVHYLASNLNPGVATELKPYIKKFNVNARDKYGQTPLLVAVIEGNPSMVQFFLEHGARTDIPLGRYGGPPIYWACEEMTSDRENEFLQCTELLLQYKADPQFVALNDRGVTMTIFAAAAKENINQIKYIVAHLAILEKLGTPITEMTRTKINENDLLKEYFSECQRVLEIQVADRVMLFDLLTSDKKEMARYLNNENIAEKLEDEGFTRKMKHYKYYNSVLNRIVMEAKRYKILKNKAARAICKIFHNRISTTDLIIDIMFDYLNDQSLRQLCRFYYQLSIQI